jgi:hypothetical protein
MPFRVMQFQTIAIKKIQYEVTLLNACGTFFLAGMKAQ